LDEIPNESVASGLFVDQLLDPHQDVLEGQAVLMEGTDNEELGFINSKGFY
jgi:hypothetical protein